MTPPNFWLWKAFAYVLLRVKCAPPPPIQSRRRTRRRLVKRQVIQSLKQVIHNVKRHRAHVTPRKNLRAERRVLVINACFDGKLHGAVFRRYLSCANARLTPTIAYPTNALYKQDELLARKLQQEENDIATHKANLIRTDA